MIPPVGVTNVTSNFDINQIRIAGDQLSAAGEYPVTNPQVYTFLYGLNGQQVLGAPGQAHSY